MHRVVIKNGTSSDAINFVPFSPDHPVYEHYATVNENTTFLQHRHNVTRQHKLIIFITTVIYTLIRIVQCAVTFPPPVGSTEMSR